MLIPAIVILLVIIVIAIANKCSNKIKWKNTK